LSEPNNDYLRFFLTTWVGNSFCAIPDSKLQIPEMIRANSLSDHEKCLTDRFHTGNPVPEMPYRKFEDLPVWKDAAHLAQLIFELTSQGVFRNHSGLRNQLERAALSISNNIAEGFERGSNNELVAFLYIARGSAGEVRSMLRLLTTWAVSVITRIRFKIWRFDVKQFRNNSIVGLNNSRVQAFAVSGISTLSLRRDLPNRLAITTSCGDRKNSPPIVSIWNLQSEIWNMEFGIPDYGGFHGY
jgi:four helix bundle protein